MGLKLAKSWYEVLEEEVHKPYMQDLKKFLEEEKGRGVEIYPSEDHIFQAFLETPFLDVKVVLVGQDPYHGRGQAHGLSFSVLPGVPTPPSLKNIFKELEADLSIPPPSNGNLSGWAKQGVLLLNTTLTVRKGEPKSHYGKGWEQFTDAVIRVLKERKDPLVFLLWGKSAQEKCQMVGPTHHKVLKAPHPSPYAASSGFFGCKHFSTANKFLESVHKTPIDWARTNCSYLGSPVCQ